MHYATNNTVANITKKDKNATDIANLSPEVTHYVRTLDVLHTSVLLTVIGLNSIAGLLYRALLFKNVHETGLFSRPINFMTGNFESFQFS